MHPANDENGGTAPPPLPTPTPTPMPTPAPTVCGAKLKNGGGTCRNAPMHGKTRCRMHGGTSPVGANSARVGLGIYSKLLPREMRRAYERSLGDPNLLSSVEEISLLQVRVEQLTKRIGTGESEDRWQKVKEAFLEFRTANARGDQDGMAFWLRDLDRLLNRGDDDGMAWAELAQFIERTSRLKQMEFRRLNEMDALATAEQVRLVVMGIAQSVMRHVESKEVRLKIVYDILQQGVVNADIASPFGTHPDDLAEAEGTGRDDGPIIDIATGTGADADPVDGADAP